MKINVFFRYLVRKGIIEASPVEPIFYERRPEGTMRNPILLSDDAILELTAKTKSTAQAFSIRSF